MAVVTSSRKKALNRVAIVAILLITLIFLSPLYWIGSTAFKPRSLATTVPPTVLFQPEITPFIKLLTKRVQLTKPVIRPPTLPPPGMSNASMMAANASCASAPISSSRNIPTAS